MADENENDVDSTPRSFRKNSQNSCGITATTSLKMIVSSPTKDVQRLFPFAKRSAITIVGRHKMYHDRNRIAFVLVATDISDNSMKELRKNMARTPLVQKYSSDELKTHFDQNNAKMIAFKKSDLASSILDELKSFRIDKLDCNETK